MGQVSDKAFVDVLLPSYDLQLFYHGSLHLGVLGSGAPSRIGWEHGLNPGWDAISRHCVEVSQPSPEEESRPEVRIPPGSCRSSPQAISSSLQVVGVF